MLLPGPQVESAASCHLIQGSQEGGVACSVLQPDSSHRDLGPLIGLLGLASSRGNKGAGQHHPPQLCGVAFCEINRIKSCSFPSPQERRQQISKESVVSVGQESTVEIQGWGEGKIKGAITNWHPAEA